MVERYSVITVDGPSGSGKGTVSQQLAHTLNWHYLDSGAIYRVLALAAIKNKLDHHDEAALAQLAHKLELTFSIDPNSLELKVFLSGGDVTSAIRSEHVGQIASIISALPAVRQALLAKQRSFAQSPGLVTDGRDMGTVVFPDADLKIYLDAELEQRAQRRYKQLSDKGINVNLDTILTELKTRDQRDRWREVAPLKAATDAVYIDTSSLSIEQVVALILSEVKVKLVDASG